MSNIPEMVKGYLVQNDGASLPKEATFYLTSGLMALHPKDEDFVVRKTTTDDEEKVEVKSLPVLERVAHYFKKSDILVFSDKDARKEHIDSSKKKEKVEDLQEKPYLKVKAELHDNIFKVTEILKTKFANEISKDRVSTDLLPDDSPLSALKGISFAVDQIQDVMSKPVKELALGFARNKALSLFQEMTATHRGQGELAIFSVLLYYYFACSCE